METDNIFKIHNWKIKKFFTVILSIQLAVIGIIGLEFIGLSIPILRPLIGFFYLTFVPGILILRLLKLNNLDTLESLLYSIGLSISCCMLIGLFANFFYPLLGINKPINLFNLLITMTFFIIFLCILSYISDSNINKTSCINLKSLFSPQALILYILPFLSIIGTYLVNFHSVNFLLMALMITVGILTIYIIISDFPLKLYPLAVFSISLTVIFHTTLISQYIWGWDVQTEYYIVNQVLKNNFWESTLSSDANAMLSLVFLAPFYSKICGINLQSVFKVIYPFLFSLIPLGLYHFTNKLFKEKIAFLSAIFFIFQFTFFISLPALARQGIAELFLIIFVITMISQNLNNLQRSSLLIVFALSLILSHYSLSYIFIILLFFTWFTHFFFFRINLDSKYFRHITSFSDPSSKIALNFVLLAVVFSIGWYIYNTNSSIFFNTVNVFLKIGRTFLNEFLDPTSVQSLSLITKDLSFFRELARYLHLITQLFIMIGFIALLYSRSKYKMNKEYFLFSLFFILILIASVIVPNLSSSIGTSRVYHIALIILSPYFVIGFLFSIKLLLQSSKSFEMHNKFSYVIVSIFLAFFFFFNSGLVFELTKDNPTSIALSQNSLEKYAKPEYVNAFYSEFFKESDVIGVQWLSNNKNQDINVYGDYTRKNLLFRSYGNMFNEKTLYHTVKNLTGYIFLGYPNVKYGMMYEPGLNNSYWKFNSTSLENMNLIYNNKEVKIYFV